MNKVYEYKTLVSIGDTNVMRNMYFLNFFKLQGIVRELWVKDCVEGGFQDLANGLLLITKDAQCDFQKDFYLYDEIAVRYYFSEIGRTYAVLNFDYFNVKNEVLHARGKQTIVFADENHRVSKIPLNWREAISDYLVAQNVKGCVDEIIEI